MLELLSSAALWVVQILLQILPDSPLQAELAVWGTQIEGFAHGLRVLNAFVDVDRILVVIDLWSAAMTQYLLAVMGVGIWGKLKRWLSGAGSFFGGAFENVLEP